MPPMGATQRRDRWSSRTRRPGTRHAPRGPGTPRGSASGWSASAPARVPRGGTAPCRAILRESVRSSSKSSGRGVAARIRSSASTSRRVPIRQGTALPHASRADQSRKKRAVSTMQVPASVTSIGPSPMPGAGGVQAARTRIGSRARRPRALRRPARRRRRPWSGPTAPPAIVRSPVQRVPSATSSKPGWATLPKMVTSLVPVLLVSDRRERLGGVGQDPGRVGEGLRVLDHGRRAHRPALGGIGRPDHRHPAVAGQCGQQRGLLAGDQRPGAFPDADAGRRHRCPAPGSRRSAPPPPRRLPCAVGSTATLQSRRTATIASDAPMAKAAMQQPFQDEVRVALGHRAIAERGRIGAHQVGDHDLAIAGRRAGRPPLLRGRDSRRRRGRGGPRPRSRRSPPRGRAAPPRAQAGVAAVLAVRRQACRDRRARCRPAGAGSPPAGCGSGAKARRRGHRQARRRPAAAVRRLRAALVDEVQRLLVGPAGRRPGCRCAWPGAIAPAPTSLGGFQAERAVRRRLAGRDAQLVARGRASSSRPPEKRQAAQVQTVTRWPSAGRSRNPPRPGRAEDLRPVDGHRSLLTWRKRRSGR